MALLFQGHDSEAEAPLREAVRLRPAHPMANYYLGLIELNSDRFEDAARHLEKAAKAAPDHADAFNACGIALSRLGNATKALRMFRTAMRIDPELPNVAKNFADALAATDRLRGVGGR